MHHNLGFPSAVVCLFLEPRPCLASLFPILFSALNVLSHSLGNLVQAPRTPLGTVAGPAGAGLLPSPGTLLATGAAGGATGLSTPTSRLPGGAGPTGTYKK